jgi:sulfonate transport system substrate-binding protein
VPRRLASALLAVLVLPLALAGCGSSSGGSDGKAKDPGTVPAAQLSAVTLRVGDQKGGSQSLLTAAGLDKNTPYRIAWSTFSSGPPLLEAANAGAIDIGGVGNTPPIFAAAAGSKVDIVAASRQAPSTNTILVPQNSSIRDVASLRGKTVAVAKGSSAHGHLLAELARAGLKPTDLNISYLQPSDANAAFSTGRIDAWAIWDPYGTLAVQQEHARVLADGGDGTANGYAFQVASRKALADPALNTAISDYLTRLARARGWASTHQTQWAHVWAQQTGLPYPVALATVQRQAERYVSLSSTVPAEQQLADILSAAKVLPAKVTVADAVDDRYRTALAPYAAG